jgi:hypothetical protein
VRFSRSGSLTVLQCSGTKCGVQFSGIVLGYGSLLTLTFDPHHWRTVAEIRLRW